MEIINYENPNKVYYFDLRDYISKIKLEDYVLEHIKETNTNFDIYMKRIRSYNMDDIIHFWLIETAKELASSARIERHYIDKEEYLKKDLFFDTLKVSHERIHSIHSFVMDNETTGYRTGPVKVGYKDKEGNEHVYWHAPEAEDVPKFMESFLNVYKSKDLSLINSNPFLKSALIQLLFIRIHPYSDGNGRTSRILYSTKFTDECNKLYGTKIKLSPLNISASILLNQYNYVKILDSIYFDLEHDNNEQINRWFNFILNMADEQLYFLQNHYKMLDATYHFYSYDYDRMQEMLKRLMNDIDKLDSKVYKKEYK